MSEPVIANQVDGDPRWLELARQNADALEAAARVPDTVHQGRAYYGYRHYRCVDQYAPGCESGQVRWVLDHTRDTSAQAWPQHLQSAMALRLSPDRQKRSN